jgi:hypothetical protein
MIELEPGRLLKQANLFQTSIFWRTQPNLSRYNAIKNWSVMHEELNSCLKLSEVPILVLRSPTRYPNEKAGCQ